ncbi:MAG: outer membrane protein assembly factor BamE, partial [Gemmatimonadetes bacterium]|nr:outer membrane protein assembly factor BamE [Gemmatimonadota bacterium]
MAEAKTVARWMAALLAACAAPAAAQTITPGMSSAQVQSVLGAPVVARQSGDWSYLYYLNGCAVRCGSDDVVFLQNDRVVTAVFRTGRRRFAGPRADATLERTSEAVAA